MNPRDAYLAWQADIGTEDVILVEPWVRPAGAPASSPALAPPSANLEPFPSAPRGGMALDPDYESPAASAPSAPASPGGAPAGTSVMGENFFQSIAAALSKPDPFVSKRAARPAAPVRASEAPAAPASEIPEFRDLEAYWSFLESVYPQWYPGAALPLARARGNARPALAVVEFAPSSEGLFAGEAGALLDRMLKAIDLRPEQLYLTSLMKTPPPGKAWSRRDAARMLPAFLRELRLAGCGLVLLLGETCAQIVMRTGQGLASLEEQAVNAEDLAFTATWHPEDLLKNEALKRDAWKHLKWVRARLPAS